MWDKYDKDWIDEKFPGEKVILWHSATQTLGMLEIYAVAF